MRNFFICISLLTSFLCVGQTYDFTNYNVENGLAQSQVLCIYQDYDGYMWFGTAGGGVSKFDGKTFTNYSSQKDIPNVTVFSITGDKKGAMYFATFSALQIKTKYEDIRIDTSKGLPNNVVYKVLIDRAEKVWVATQQGVCYLNEKRQPVKLTGDKTLENTSVFTMFQDHIGNFWFGTMKDGVCCYVPNIKKFIWYQVQGLVYSLNEDANGTVYVGTEGGLYTVKKNQKLEPFFIKGLSTENIAFTNILADNKGNLWFSTNEGVIKYKNGNYKKFLDKNGLCSNILMSSYMDRENNLWVGSNGAGISKLSSEAFVNYDENSGLTGDYINAVCQTRDNSVWLAMRGYGLLRITKSEQKKYSQNLKKIKETLISNSINCMAQDSGDVLWIGSEKGVSQLNIKTEKIVNYWINSDYELVYSICHTHDGKHYIGTEKGLVLFAEGGKKEPIDAVNKLKGSANMSIYDIVEDKKHNLWLATASYGVIKYDGKSVEMFNSRNKFTDKTVYNIVEDKDGNFWFGTEDGVFYYDNKTFTLISDKDGLVSNQACLLLFDKENKLWIGTNKGVNVLQTDLFVSKKEIHLKYYGKEEGIKGVECNMNAAVKDKENNLWFGTIKGAAVFNPQFEKVNMQEPSCLITDMKLFFEKTDLSPFSKGVDSLSGLPIQLELPYNKNHITINYIGISQTNPDKVLYQIKMEGVDADWTPVTAKNEVTYSSLQPGKYTFYLKAMNNDGVWNKTPLQYSFVILPPWYKTWWFYTICVVLVLVIISAYSQYKTKKLYADKLKLEEQVAVRTHELREEKEKVEIINKEVLAQKTTIEHKNQEITDSINYAKNIQEALLPPITSLKKDFPESFVLYMPKDIVSGDFYWFATREGKNLFAAADCTGHGVPGAFMSIVGNSLLNEIIVEQHIYQPAQILNHLHVGVKTALNQNKNEFERRDGMDVALCSFNKETSTLEYAGANRALWIYRKENPTVVEIIKPDKFPIGGIEYDFETVRKFRHHEIKMQKGDCVYLFSDGYADQFGGVKGKKFMVANLQRTFSEITQLPMSEQYLKLKETYLNWRGTHEQVDDVLVIGLRL